MMVRGGGGGHRPNTPVKPQDLIKVCISLCDIYIIYGSRKIDVTGFPSWAPTTLYSCIPPPMPRCRYNRNQRGNKMAHRRNKYGEGETENREKDGERDTHSV